MVETEGLYQQSQPGEDRDNPEVQHKFVVAEDSK